MVKVSSSDALAILRRFQIADDEHVPRHIEQLRFYEAENYNTLVSFRFLKKQYFLLFDDTAEDDRTYIESQLQYAQPDLKGRLLANPNDHTTTYGLPFKGKDVYLFVVDSGRVRLDVELARRYPDTSRSTWQKYVKDGRVTVDGTIQLSPKLEVTDQAVIAVSEPPRPQHDDKELPIVYIDDDVIVINKPAGILTHSKGVMNDEFTVADFFRRYTDVGLDTNRPGIVHRLDRDTSGIMIGARTPEAFELLKRQFAERKAKKHYRAITVGIPNHETAVIDVPIGRNPSAPSTFRVDPSGKSAVTEYQVLETNHETQRALVELLPKTGRTHQLRVHMQYLGTPILGDRVYGSVTADRLYLHAELLEITIVGGERKTFIAPVPSGFRV